MYDSSHTRLGFVPCCARGIRCLGFVTIRCRAGCFCLLFLCWLCRLVFYFPLGRSRLVCAHAITALRSEAVSITISFLADARSSSSSRSQAEQTCEHIVQHGETSWDVANTHGVSLTNLRNANRDNKMLMFDALVEGDAVQLPPECLSNSAIFILCGSALFSCRKTTKAYCFLAFSEDLGYVACMML